MAVTYYIRSWDPDSTYPSNPQEGDLCYTITLDQSWSPVAGVKEDNILKKEVFSNGSWTEEGSGGGIKWKRLSVGQGGLIMGGSIVYHTDGAVDEEGVAIWTGGGMFGGKEVDIAEGGIVVVKAESTQANTKWNGSCVTSGCDATLLGQNTNAKIIYRTYKISNISSGASFYCEALFNQNS